jgi:hypothetical protein
MRVNALIGLCFEDDRGRKIPVGSWTFTESEKVREFIDPFPEHTNIKITDKGKAALLVFFDKGLPLEGQAIVPSLDQLTHMVCGVIEGIETVFTNEQAWIDAHPSM